MAAGVARLFGAGAPEPGERFGPDREAGAAPGKKLLGWGLSLGKTLWAGVAFGVGWVVSAKDDLFGPEDRNVNPVSLIAKLLILLVCAWVLIIGTVKAVR